MKQHENRDEFAAFVTIFSLLVTIQYSDGGYDVWDSLLALVVIVFLTTNWRTLFKEFRTSIIALFGYALSISTIILCFCPEQRAEKFLDLDFGIFIGIFLLLLLGYCFYPPRGRRSGEVIATKSIR